MIETSPIKTSSKPYRSRVVAAAAAALAFVALAGSEVRAQDPSGVTSDLERTASTTPQEKISYAESSNEEIRDAEKQITRLLEQARKDNDAEAIECLANRLTSVRALLQVSESAEVAMRDSIAAGLVEKANHEFRKIAVAISKTRMLLAEAQRCASEQQVEPGQTLVDWESALADENDLASLDPTDFTFGGDPPQVSPFL
jgi:DNA-binding phage protein